MIVAHVKVSGVHATRVRLSAIPAGLIGGQVAVEYVDPIWKGMTKTAVFRGAVTKDVLDAGDIITIPSEVVAVPGAELYFGIYGTDSDGNLAIPLLEANLGKVAKATDPSGDTSTDPSLPVWAQLQEQIDDLKDNGTGNGGGGVYFETDETLTLKDGVLSVNTATAAEEDNTLPITSAAVHTAVGNIELLLSRI